MNEIRTKNRLIRTEVIWTSHDDSDDRCPVNLDAVWRKKKPYLLTAILALSVLATQRTKMSSNLIGRTNPLAMAYEFEDKRMGVTLGAIDAVGNETKGWADNENKTMDITTSLLRQEHQQQQQQVTLPKTLDENLADVDEPLRDGDVPYFFHAPRTMGQTAKEILGICVGINMTAANLTATIEGIYKAKKMGLLESDSSDSSVGIIFTQYLHAGAHLFNSNHRGRMFTMFRHPIERAVSMFHYLPKAKHEPTYDPDLSHISIEMWSRSKRVEHNWMTRFLSNELEADLTLEHLEISKEVLRKKCIIGLFDEKSESWLRLERFFRWKFPPKDNRECLDRLLNWGWSNKNLHPTVEEGSNAWELLYKQNEFDMMLYQHAQLLFEQQRTLFGEGGILV